MKVIKCNLPVYVDVDETLLIHNKKRLPHPDNIKIGDSIFIPHKPHIEQLKAHSARKHTIIVWSAGGYAWAKTAVKILKLQKYVNVVIEKPRWAMDDLEPNKFIDHYYIPYDPFKIN